MNYVGQFLVDLLLNNEKLKIMVVNDEADILMLYSDYFSNRGHQVLKTYLTAENVMDDIERERPNMYVIDYKLHGTKDGIDLATKFTKIPFIAYTLCYC